jgi:hypothetical protein
MAQYAAPQAPFDDSTAIIDLLNFLKAFLDEIFAPAGAWYPLLPSENREALRQAYTQQIRGQIDALIGLVGAPAFRNDPRRAEFGLGGPSLGPKLGLVQTVNDQLPRNPILDDIVNDRPRGVRGAMRKGARNVLEAIDIVLDSLTRLLGAHEGLVEFKKALALLLGIREDYA